ncbi:hypothetical protein J6590_035392 [Homalodisca vitripennis]|nr:hypothetical protein J6590_035392 [Homalodisca vitripennis]
MSYRPGMRSHLMNQMRCAVCTEAGGRQGVEGRRLLHCKVAAVRNSSVGLRWTSIMWVSGSEVTAAPRRRHCWATVVRSLNLPIAIIGL